MKNGKKLWCELKTDLEKAQFIESGRAVETGVIAPAIAEDIARVYRKSGESVADKILKQVDQWKKNS